MKWYGRWCPECRRMHFTWPGSIVVGLTVWTVIYAITSALR